MTCTTRYLVQIIAWTEATQWITADTPQEAELLAEADFRRNGRRNFKIADEGVQEMHIQANHQFAGTA